MVQRVELERRNLRQEERITLDKLLLREVRDFVPAKIVNHARERGILCYSLTALKATMRL